MKKILMSINKDLKETRLHGTIEFPMAIYFSVLNEYAMGFINWHWHDDMQFCYVIRGAVKFYVNGNEYFLNTEEGIFVNSKYLHMARPAGDLDSAYLCLDFSPNLLKNFSGSVFELRYLTPYIHDDRYCTIKLGNDTPEEIEILKLIRQIYTLYAEQNYGYELQCMEKLYTIWYDLISLFSFKQLSKTIEGTGHNETMKSLLDYIEKNYKEHLTLEALASHVSLSKSECCRQFRQFTGETLFSYIQAIRLTHAVQLLNDRCMSITEIAYQTGFCSSSYFIETFRKRMGVTPRQYRNERSKKPAQFTYINENGIE